MLRETFPAEVMIEHVYTWVPSTPRMSEIIKEFVYILDLRFTTLCIAWYALSSSVMVMLSFSHTTLVGGKTLELHETIPSAGVLISEFEYQLNRLNSGVDTEGIPMRKIEVASYLEF